MNTRSWSELFSQCVWNIPSPPHHHLLQLIFFFLNFLNPLRTTLWTRLLYIAAASTDLRCHQCINTLLLSAGRNWECLSIIIYRRSSGENEKTSNRVFDFLLPLWLFIHTHDCWSLLLTNPMRVMLFIFIEPLWLFIHTHDCWSLLLANPMRFMSFVFVDCLGG